MALKGNKDNSSPLIKTSIQLREDIKAIVDMEANTLKMSRSAIIGNILENYYKMPKTDYPNWNPKHKTEDTNHPQQ